MGLRPHPSDMPGHDPLPGDAPAPGEACATPSTDPALPAQHLPAALLPSGRGLHPPRPGRAAGDRGNRARRKHGEVLGGVTARDATAPLSRALQPVTAAPGATASASGHFPRLPAPPERGCRRRSDNQNGLHRLRPNAVAACPGEAGPGAQPRHHRPGRAGARSGAELGRGHAAGRVGTGPGARSSALLSPATAPPQPPVR